MKHVGFLLVVFSEHVVFHERGRRGRSWRENSAKILAAALSQRDFLMVLGVGGYTWKTPDQPPLAASMLMMHMQEQVGNHFSMT